MDRPLTFGSLFSGIGAMDYGLERAGLVCKWQCEIDPYCRQVLRKHWPDIPIYDDVRTFHPTDEHKVDVIAGGFPCQDISQAGFGEGLNGERSGLWSEFRRAIRVLRPRYAIVENVSALLIRGLGDILLDLSALGYDAEWQTVCASDFALPHRRERLFIVAYPNQSDGNQGMGDQQNWKESIFRISPEQRDGVRVQTADRFVGMDDGLAFGVYASRCGAIGNAVAAPIAQWIGQCIKENERDQIRSEAQSRVQLQHL